MDSTTREGLVGRAAMIEFFKCKRCGKCCTEINNIDLHLGDIQRIARFLGESESRIRDQFTAPTSKAGIVRVKSQPCPFYDREAKGCRIYSARPYCCRMYPFLTADAAGDLVNLAQCPSGMDTLLEFMKSDIGDYIMNHPSKDRTKKIFIESLKKMGLSSRTCQEMVKSMGF